MPRTLPQQHSLPGLHALHFPKSTSQRVRDMETMARAVSTGPSMQRTMRTKVVLNMAAVSTGRQVHIPTPLSHLNCPSSPISFQVKSDT